MENKLKEKAQNYRFLNVGDILKENSTGILWKVFQYEYDRSARRTYYKLIEIISKKLSGWYRLDKIKRNFTVHARVEVKNTNIPKEILESEIKILKSTSNTKDKAKIDKAIENMKNNPMYTETLTEKELKKRTAELIEAAKVKLSLHQKIKSLEEENRKQKHTISCLDHTLNRLNETLTNVRKYSNELYQELKDKMKQISLIEKDNSDLQKEFKEMLDSEKELKKQLDSHQKLNTLNKNRIEELLQKLEKELKLKNLNKDLIEDLNLKLEVAKAQRAILDNINITPFVEYSSGKILFKSDNPQKIPTLCRPISNQSVWIITAKSPKRILPNTKKGTPK